jgi:hypothetical protein
MESSEPPVESAEGLSEEEVRARVEEQISRVRVQDLLLESVVGILNLSARRIAKDDERDLEQARIGIEAVRAVVHLLEPEPSAAVREALSELQLLYARQAQGAQAAEAPDDGDEPTAEAPPEPPPSAGRPGPEPPPRLWTPGSG